MPSNSISFEVAAAAPSMNLLLRKHWSYRKNQKALWMELMHAQLGRNGMATLRAWRELSSRVRVKIHVSHKRQFDPDNLVSCAKIPLDALKALRCIVDDSSRWIDLLVEESLGEVGTRITITNLEGAVGAGKPRSLARFSNRRRGAQ